MLHIIADRPARLQCSIHVADEGANIALTTGKLSLPKVRVNRGLSVADLGAIHEEGDAVLARLEPGQGHAPAPLVLRQAGCHPGTRPGRACTDNG